MTHFCRITILSLVATMVLLLTQATGAPAIVGNIAELRAAVEALKPGSAILLKPGDYAGRVTISDKHGTADEPITIAALDPRQPPVFRNGDTAFQLRDCAHVVLRDLIVRDCSSNGINIDDAGTIETPAHHITLENIVIERVGPQGNIDALKLSGLDDFAVRRCTLRGWGGSAIDMVGCHRGVVEHCIIEGIDGFSQHSGLQMKGGSADIAVRRNYFNNAGMRAINLGGSTGLQFFRPKPEGFEATRIEVAHNRFTGGETAVAFVTARGGHVHHNIIHQPTMWVFRILQETEDASFAPSGGGVFEHNLIVYSSSLRATVNVGAGTAPETFVLRNNAWFCAESAALPQLPAREEGGIYGVDPQVLNAGTAEMSIGSGDPRFAGIGPQED